MQGTITKKHFWQAYKVFGIKKALRLFFTAKPVALALLMSLVFVGSSLAADNETIWKFVCNQMNYQTDLPAPAAYIVSDADFNEIFTEYVFADWWKSGYKKDDPFIEYLEYGLEQSLPWIMAAYLVRIKTIFLRASLYNPKRYIAHEYTHRVQDLQKRLNSRDRDALEYEARLMEEKWENNQ